MDYSKYACLLVSIEEGIATVTLNRPEQLNTTTGGLHLDLEYVFADLAEENRTARCVGEGAELFQERQHLALTLVVEVILHAIGRERRCLPQCQTGRRIVA